MRRKKQRGRIMVTTYQGLEVNFCENCGRELYVTKGYDKSTIWVQCPKRHQLFGFIDNKDHDRFYVGDFQYPIKYDRITGKKLA